jgi:CTP synthase (UTP-ammonia lyase)
MDLLKKNSLCFTGKSTDGRRMETLELPEHYFFFLSVHGEFKSAQTITAILQFPERASTEVGKLNPFSPKIFL